MAACGVHPERRSTLERKVNRVECSRVRDDALVAKMVQKWQLRRTAPVECAEFNRAYSRNPIGPDNLCGPGGIASDAMEIFTSLTPATTGCSNTTRHCRRPRCPARAISLPITFSGSFFPEAQLMFIKSERSYTAPAQTVAEVVKFLDLPLHV